MARHVFCRGSKVLVFSKKDRKNLSEQLPEGKIEVFPNGIQVDRYRCGNGTFKSRRSIPEGGKAVLFAARLIREKGVYDLLEAIPLVVRDHGNAYFLIAGDGPEKQRMEAICREKGIEERVRFTGHIEGKELIEAYCCADMFIFPTLLPEGMPMVILEALAAGLPIISTASGAVPDMIQDGVNGFIIPSGDPDRLADRIGTLIDRSDWIDRMKKENVRLARREYDREIVLKKLESLYCSL
jgi:glycosyltransferase involved in cell wall biosynthesis